MLGAKDDKKKEKKEDSEKSIRDNIKKSLKDILTLRYSSFSVVLSWCFSIKGIMIKVFCPFYIFSNSVCSGIFENVTAKWTSFVK